MASDVTDSGSRKAGYRSGGDGPTSGNPSRSREGPTRRVGPSTRAFDDQDAELAAAALPLDPPEDEPEDDPEEDDEPEDAADEDEDPDEDDADDELSLEDDSDLAGLLVVPPAVVSEPDARESVR
ncbi:hypothetical protein [Micromonospora violae]|uniref:hypothetical protein n=1 Tax=Micromonospora violae TaxID=1278207 RepID=UPI0033D507C6